MCIRKSPNQKMGRVLINIFILVAIFGAGLSDILLAQEHPLFVEAVNSRGDWKEGVVAARRVIFTDKAGAGSEIDIDVPAEGKYQLLAYIHHNWRNRNAFPYIRVEAVDAKGSSHSGSHTIENIWYLEDNDSGRWFFVSLSENPYWELPEGRVRLKFRAEGRSSPWEDKSVPLEGKVSIYGFILAPVTVNGDNSHSFLLINPEHCGGRWNVVDYDKEYSTNFVETEKKGAEFSCAISIPKAAYYSGVFSVLSAQGGSLGVEIENKGFSFKRTITLKNNPEWQMCQLELVYLNKGGYSIKVKNLKPTLLKMDFLLLSARIDD